VAQSKESRSQKIGLQDKQKGFEFFKNVLNYLRYAYIEFEDTEAVEAALILSDSILAGR
jgi:hypothetical protein